MFGEGLSAATPAARGRPSGTRSALAQREARSIRYETGHRGETHTPLEQRGLFARWRRRTCSSCVARVAQMWNSRRSLPSTSIRFGSVSACFIGAGSGSSSAEERAVGAEGPGRAGEVDAERRFVDPIEELLAGPAGVVAVGERERGGTVPLHGDDGHRLARDHPGHARAGRQVLKTCHGLPLATIGVGGAGGTGRLINPTTGVGRLEASLGSAAPASRAVGRERSSGLAIRDPASARPPSPHGVKAKPCSSTRRTQVATTSASYLTPACARTSARAAAMPSAGR